VKKLFKKKYCYFVAKRVLLYHKNKKEKLYFYQIPREL